MNLHRNPPLDLLRGYSFIVTMCKEPYVTAEDIDEKGEMWLKALPYRKRWRAEIEAVKSALLVVDMQNFFLVPKSHAYLPAAPAIIGNINGLVDLFLRLGGKVIYTRTVQDTQHPSTMLQWWSSTPVTEGEMANIFHEISVKGPVIVKPTYSSFLGTELDVHLDGMENVFICGVMTDLCCETTCRDAFVRDYRTFFIADGTATTTEKMHISSLISMCNGLAEVLLCKEVEQRLQ